MAGFHEPGRRKVRVGMDTLKSKQVKAYWRGFEIFDIDFHYGWCDIVFWMDHYKSPLTGTGRFRVRPEDIELMVVEQ